MARQVQRVYLLLTDFKGDLLDLSQKGHVWIVNSEINTPAIVAVWAKTKIDSEVCGVTSFTPGNDAIGKLYELLITIAEHHSGDDVHSLPWNELLIHGVNLPEIDVEEVEWLLNTKVIVAMQDQFIRIQKTT